MDKEATDLFERLRVEVYDLAYGWSVYKKLFESDAETIELLNDTATSFFVYFQHLLERSMVLSITRLLDPITSMGKSNLAISTLLVKLEGVIDNEVIVRFNKKLQKLQKKAKTSITPMRNKTISHLDLSHATGKESLNPVTMKEIGSMICRICGVFNKIQIALDESSTSYHSFIDHTGPDLLLRYLKSGWESEQEQRRLKTGK